MVYENLSSLLVNVKKSDYKQQGSMIIYINVELSKIITYYCIIIHAICPMSISRE